MSSRPGNPETLRARFSAARAMGKRAKDAAQYIGISEGEAVAAHCGVHDHAPKAVALRKPHIELLQALQLCGPLMGLTRNENVVHEKTGVYEKISAQGHMGLALGEDIDLRLFLNQWHAGYAVTELAANPGNRANISLQFFDKHGKAVHKIFQREATDLEAWQAVATHFAEPGAVHSFAPAGTKPPPKLDTECDAKALVADWAAMQDTHEFFGLLSHHAVQRQQSFRLVEGRFTHRMKPGAVRDMLHEAAFDGTSIMVFVSSGGCIQIHTGPVKRIEPIDVRGTPWLNILDPGFNLHLREDRIAHVWLVEKPTADGTVTSLEVFDTQGDLMVMFFGERKPGKPELQGWRNIVARLPKLAAVQDAVSSKSAQNNALPA